MTRRAHTLDTIAGALAASGDHGLAVTSYGEALTIVQGLGDAQGEALVRLHLGRALRDRGDHGYAVDQWQRALAILTAPSDPAAADVREEIDGLTSRR